MMSTMLHLAAFFNFAPKRQRKLEAFVQAASPDSKKKRMIDFYKTRWVERHTAFESFESLQPAINDCLC